MGKQVTLATSLTVTGIVDSTIEEMPKTVLLVDDQDGNRIMTKWFLNHFGYTVETARTAEEALSLFNSKVHDVIVTDNCMPGMSGAELAHIVKLRSPSTPVVMFSGAPPSDHTCLDVVIRRPAHLMRLREAVDQLLVVAGGSPARTVNPVNADMT